MSAEIPPMSDRPVPTSRDVDAVSSPILCVALGSWEQHGPHLPLDTDTRIAVELTRRLAQRMNDLVLGPTITVSSSGEHARFAGTLSVGGKVVVDTIVELVRSATWAMGTVIVNGHGGNCEYLEDARRTLVTEGHAVTMWSPSIEDPTDSHAGYIETSVMMAIDPASVRTSDIHQGVVLPLTDIIADLRRHGLIDITPSGVLGDPTRADEDLGHRLLATWEDDLVESVTAWRAAVRRAPVSGPST